MVKYFCCCCELRTGTIVFAWLQMIFIALATATMSCGIVLLNSNESRVDPIAFNSIYFVLAIVITTQVLKALTCICLTWGTINKNYLFYQPWLFTQGMESTIMSLAAISLFIAGFAVLPLFAIFIPCAIVAGLGWYFWTCVYSLYQRDKKSLSLLIEDGYDTLIMGSSNS